MRGYKELQKPSHVFLVIMHNTTIRDIYKRVGERRCDLQFCSVSSNRCTQFLQDPEHCDSAVMVMVSKKLLWLLVVVVMAVEVLSLETVSDDDEYYEEGSAVSDGSNWDDEDGRMIGSVQMLVQSESNTVPHFNFQVMKNTKMKIMQKMKTIILNRRTVMLMLTKMIYL